MNANRIKSLLSNTQKCLNHVLLLEQLKKLPGWEKPHAKAVAWSYDIEGHALKRVERYCELASKKTDQLYKVSSPCLDNHHFQKKELVMVRELSKNMLTDCSKMLVFGANWKTRHSMVSQ